MELGMGDWRRERVCISIEKHTPMVHECKSLPSGVEVAQKNELFNVWLDNSGKKIVVLNSLYYNF
jgi:hypothetical protein